MLRSSGKNFGFVFSNCRVLYDRDILYSKLGCLTNNTKRIWDPNPKKSLRGYLFDNRRIENDLAVISLNVCFEFSNKTEKMYLRQGNNEDFQSFATTAATEMKEMGVCDPLYPPGTYLFYRTLASTIICVIGAATAAGLT